MTTFDQILPRVINVLKSHQQTVDELDWLLINRDLNGRVRLIAPEAVASDEAVRGKVVFLAAELAEQHGPRSEPGAAVCVGR